MLRFEQSDVHKLFISGVCLTYKVKIYMELYMGNAIILGTGIFCIYGASKDFFSVETAVWIFFLTPVAAIVVAAIYEVIDNVRFANRMEREKKEFIDNLSGRAADYLRDADGFPKSKFKDNVYTKPEVKPDAKPEPPKFPCLLDSEQIQSLVEFRETVSDKDLERYNYLAIHGMYMSNIVPEAGLFTARLNRESGKQTNVVALLATKQAISDFKEFCYNRYVPNIDYYAKGYIIDLPNQGYSILWVTTARMGSRSLRF
jgi:hypothetical protein